MLTKSIYCYCEYCLAIRNLTNNILKAIESFEKIEVIPGMREHKFIQNMIKAGKEFIKEDEENDE